MPAQKRRGLLPRRRRHDDEGEEDGSTTGELEYLSSEGSLTSDAEEDGDASLHSTEVAQSLTPSPTLQRQTGQDNEQGPSFETTADTKAMLNRLKIAADEEAETLHFDDAPGTEAAPQQHDRRQQEQRPRPRTKNVTKQPSTSQPVDLKAREYSRHDDRVVDRGIAPPAGPRGRGRGFGHPSMRGNLTPLASETAKQWTHDLHETVNKPATPRQTVAPIPPVTSLSTPPNRSFSTTTVLGNVPVQVLIPATQQKASRSMVKKHYTLLPQHRPPLRRDKPVRISIPGEHPRYIFPSTERSFIFIPRAMRPNQQAMRGRGRGSFHGSRRPSLYAASSYTPSVGMSRRPSMAASNAGSGMHTPTGTAMPPFSMGALQKSIVRMPALNTMPFIPTMQNEVFLGDNSAIIHSPPATLPMHQPLPQKPISVTDIESPTRGPPQHSQQPFHQQIPTLADNSQLKMPHIPEGAVYAQPFQPYSQAWYGPIFPHEMMAPDGGMGFSMGMGGPVMAPMQRPSTQQSQVPVAHESNGMVYYYDPSQQYPAPMMNLMPPTPYYYPPVPNQMFYQ